MFDSFDINPFSFGGGGFSSFSPFALSALPGAGSSPVGVQSSGAGTVASVGNGTVDGLLGWGLKFYQTYLNADLANEQVAKGQYPSQNASTNLLGGNVANFGGLVPLLIIFVVVIVIFKALRKR